MTTLYEAVPFRPAATRAHIVSHIMRSLCTNDLVFDDSERACDERCFECVQCRAALVASSKLLSTPGAIVLEIWEMEAELPIGVVVVLPISSTEAQVSFTFFDGKLADKRDILQGVADWVFEVSQLHRLTVEVPDYAFSLARFVNRHLGFGGDFSFKHKQNVIAVEGLRRGAARWRGSDRDVLVLGRVR